MVRPKKKRIFKTNSQTNYLPRSCGLVTRARIQKTFFFHHCRTSSGYRRSSQHWSCNNDAQVLDASKKIAKKNKAQQNNTNKPRNWKKQTGLTAKEVKHTGYASSLNRCRSIRFPSCCVCIIHLLQMSESSINGGVEEVPPFYCGFNCFCCLTWMQQRLSVQQKYFASVRIWRFPTPIVSFMPASTVSLEMQIMSSFAIQRRYRFCAVLTNPEFPFLLHIPMLIYCSCCSGVKDAMVVFTRLVNCHFMTKTCKGRWNNIQNKKGVKQGTVHRSTESARTAEEGSGDVSQTTPMPEKKQQHREKMALVKPKRKHLCQSQCASHKRVEDMK